MQCQKSKSTPLCKWISNGHVCIKTQILYKIQLWDSQVKVYFRSTFETLTAGQSAVKMKSTKWINRRNVNKINFKNIRDKNTV